MTPGIPFPDISPIAFSLGPLQIRWYALAYLAGFVLGWQYALKLVRHDPGRRPNAEDIDEILPWLVLGVILGGRLGYVLFYNLEYYLENPLHIPFVWEGGMSFHGGFLGVVVAIMAYARRHKFQVLALSDVISSVVPIGLFFGRIANFINGELFGRVTEVSWGVVFPQGGSLPRHPSQLYEAFLEGICLFIALFIAGRYPGVRQRPGTLSGIFLVGYGLSRFIVEFFREPDAQIGYLLGVFSMGQLLSFPMILLGVGIVYCSQKLTLKK